MLLEEKSAAIGIKYPNSEIIAITLDFGGNPANAGAILQAKYHKEKDIKALLDLGRLILLRENVNPSSQNHVYIIKDGKEWGALLEPRTTVSMYRDVMVYKNGVYRTRRLIKAQPFRSIEALDYLLETDWIYIFDKESNGWLTYVKGEESGAPRLLKNLDYKSYITNLLARDELNELTREEKVWLKERKIEIKL